MRSLKVFQVLLRKQNGVPNGDALLGMCFDGSGNSEDICKSL